MPAADLRAGSTASARYVVTHSDTAVSLGSGGLAVLASPRLLAWMEGATVAVLAGYLRAGESSVGTRIGLEHLKASAVDTVVVVAAELRHVDGRLVRFEVVASDVDGAVVARAEITRVIVDEARFLARLV